MLEAVAFGDGLARMEVGAREKTGRRRDEGLALEDAEPRAAVEAVGRAKDVRGKQKPEVDDVVYFPMLAASLLFCRTRDGRIEKEKGERRTKGRHSVALSFARLEVTCHAEAMRNAFALATRRNPTTGAESTVVTTRRRPRFPTPPGWDGEANGAEGQRQSQCQSQCQRQRQRE